MKINDTINTVFGKGLIVGFEEQQGWRRIGVKFEVLPPRFLQKMYPDNVLWMYPRDIKKETNKKSQGEISCPIKNTF